MWTKVKSYLYLLSGIVVIGSILAYIYGQYYALFAYAAGVAGMTAIRISDLSKSADIKVRRLNAIQAVSAILMLGAVYLMYIKYYGWLIAIIVAAAIDLYVSFRMPKKKKE